MGKRIVAVVLAAVLSAFAVPAGERGASDKQYGELLLLAEKGIPEAMFMAGAVSYSERNDHEAAVKWLTRASELRHAKADYFLGILYGKADAVPKDEEKSAQHMRRAALQGLPEAQLDCAYMALAGKRTDEGMKWLELAARQFHGDAHIALARLLAEPPDGGEGDMLRAYMWLGWYTKSRHDRKTYELTVNILKMLVKEMTREQLKRADGMIRAMGGDDFMKARNDKEPKIVEAVGLIEKRKYAEAVAILEPMAEKGDAAAQYHLGGMYILAEGVEKDAARAKELFERSAAQGESRALYRLGRLYENGGDMPRDYARAVKYYVEAAKKGNPFAIQNLGNMLTQGLGVEVDLDKARRVYLLTASEGDPLSQLALGLINSMQKEGARDNVEAFKWLILARPNLPPEVPQNLRAQCGETIRELALGIGDEGMEKALEAVRNFMPVEIDPAGFDWDGIEISS